MKGAGGSACTRVRESLYFTAPRKAVVRRERFCWPLEGAVLVKTELSAVSAGTEALVYKGELPSGLPLDPEITEFSGPLRYPQKYGYAAVGMVIDAADKNAEHWIGRRVFSFHAHESMFTASPDALVVIPQHIGTRDAVFLPFMETAVNFLLDGAPLIGERTVILGQGVIGLLTTALLTLAPLERIVTADKYPLRRAVSLRLGARACVDPGDGMLEERLREAVGPGGADLVFELSGRPELLAAAMNIASRCGRIIAGSWYGTRAAQLPLGGRFHRDRISLVSSQVSTLAPQLLGRWSKQRRIDTAFRMIETIRPSSLISHVLPFHDARAAYELITRQPDHALQVVFQYEGG